MDSTPALNSKEFYRAQIRKRLDKQDAFLHRQAILTIEDMRRKGTYRGMTRDMTLEEKQVCLEIEMANLGIESEEDEPDLSGFCTPVRTNTPESIKNRNCSSPLNNFQSKPVSPNLKDAVRPSSQSGANREQLNSPRVTGGTENSPCPADVPPPPFPSNAPKDTGNVKQKTLNVTLQNGDGSSDSDNLIQSPRLSSCQGDVDSNEADNKSSPRAGSVSSKISNNSNRTFITSSPPKSAKNSGRKIKYRLPQPPNVLSVSDEEMQPSYRIRENATRRREQLKLRQKR